MPSRVISRSNLKSANKAAVVDEEQPTEIIEEVTASSSDDSSSDEKGSARGEADNADEKAKVELTPQQLEHQRLIEFVDAKFALPKWKIALMIYSLLMGLGLSMMDLSIVATAEYTIAKDLDGGIGNATWIILAYTLSYLGFAVILARISDVLGRKWTTFGSFVVFIGMSAAAGSAQSLQQLIAFRAVQGMGGSGLYALGMVVLPEVTPIRMLPLIGSLIGLTVAISGILGPILGGVISEQTTWRWIFYINLPLGGSAALAFLIACPKKTRGFELGELKLRHLDWAGCLLMLGFSTMFTFGLQQGGIGAWPWSDPVITCTLMAGIFCGILFVGWQVFLVQTNRINAGTVMPMRVVRDRVLVAGIISTIMMGFCHTLVLFNLPLRFQIVNQNNPKSAGVHLIPYLGAVAFGSMFGGAASGKKNKTFGTMVISATLMLIGAGLLSTLDDGSTGFGIQKKLYGFEVIFGAGVGMSMSSITLMANMQADPRDHAVAQGIISQARVFGGSIGVAAFDALFNHELLTKLKGKIPVDKLTQVETNSDVVKSLNILQQEDIRIVFGQTWHTALLMVVGVAAICLIAAVWTWQEHPPNLIRKKMQMEALILDHARTQLAEIDREKEGQV